MLSSVLLCTYHTAQCPRGRALDIMYSRGCSCLNMRAAGHEETTALYSSLTYAYHLVLFVLECSHLWVRAHGR